MKGDGEMLLWCGCECVCVLVERRESGRGVNRWCVWCVVCVCVCVCVCGEKREPSG